MQRSSAGSTVLLQARPQNGLPMPLIREPNPIRLMSSSSTSRLPEEENGEEHLQQPSTSTAQPSPLYQEENVFFEQQSQENPEENAPEQIPNGKTETMPALTPIYVKTNGSSFGEKPSKPYRAEGSLTSSPKSSGTERVSSQEPLSVDSPHVVYSSGPPSPRLVGPVSSSSQESSAQDSQQVSPAFFHTGGEGSSKSLPMEPTAVNPEDGVRKKRKYTRRQFNNNNEQISRKSHRINRSENDAEDLVDNYIGSSKRQAAAYQAPRGLKRIPHRFPTLVKNRLIIDMNGPSTRSNPDTEDPLKKRYGRINIGKDHQVDLPPVMERSSAEETEDKEELIFSDPDGRLSTSIDDAWNVIRRQFDNRIPFDAVLHRLMSCDFDINAMLQTIELELDNLPQPFERLNVAQQEEFERAIRKTKVPKMVSSKTVEKQRFAEIQEQFMRSHYIGEIVEYYYTTKKHCCINERYARCLCRERFTSDVPPKVTRVECFNCTKTVWHGGKREKKICLICDLYHRRTGHHRICSGGFTEKEIEILDLWAKLQNDFQTFLSLKEVTEYMENERLEELRSRPLTQEETSMLPTKWATEKQDLVQLTKKFEPRALPGCTLAAPENYEMLAFRVKHYSEAEKLLFMKYFELLGNDFETVAEKMHRSVTEVSVFYVRFKRLLGLPEVVQMANARLSRSPKRHCTPDDGEQEKTDGSKTKKRRTIAATMEDDPQPKRSRHSYPK
ncbi:unnamed protein product [Caenorhabditis auriculariae]|uniref:ELM2 domain-containing protein n=1 Tax=Caenorhabditis auriculariae TaxID=2777116 RepID=A0A8S1HY80_9PELO|nr:unnamed protein product [Caenorhabditis auriculariae]